MESIVDKMSRFSSCMDVAMSACAGAIFWCGLLLRACAPAELLRAVGDESNLSATAFTGDSGTGVADLIKEAAGGFASAGRVVEGGPLALGDTFGCTAMGIAVIAAFAAVPRR